MLKVYTEELGEVQDTEKFFDANIKFFDFDKDDTLQQVARIQHIKKGWFQTPFGNVYASNLPTYVKLAICLTQCPCEFFDNRGCSTFELSKILVLPTGNLVLKLDRPLEYLFPVNAETVLGDKLKDSIDINVRMFMKGGALM